jgi:hypothetical protein
MSTILEKIQKYSTLNFVIPLITFLLFVWLGWLALVQFGWLSRQVPPSVEAEEIRKEAEFIQKYPLLEKAKKLQQIVPVMSEINIPELNPEEIGKSNPFE